MEFIAVALIAVASNLVVVYQNKQHAKERKFLINSALSNNTYEFAVRQQATEPAPAKPAEDAEDFDAFPEGLYS